MSRAVINAPRWLLLGAIIFAPWAYGSTASWAIQTLQIGLGGTCVLWLVSALMRRQAPDLPKALLPTVGFLLLQGWWMAVNAKYDYPTSDGVTADFQSEALDPWLSWAPGSVHRALSLAAMIQMSVLLGTFLMICDLAQRTTWRKRLWLTMAGTGASIGLLGIVQRLTSARSILWDGDTIQGHFFATFRNFDNAAAFLNLVWPLLAGLLLMEFRQRGRIWQKVGLGLGIALCVCGVLVSGSRTGALLAVLLLAAWMIWVGALVAKRELESLQPTTAVVGAVLVLALLGVLAVLVGHDLSLQRWSQFDRQFAANNLRWLAYRACVGMMPESGWWGFGPGTFQTAFPYFTHEFGKQISGRWLYAHQDYLQTIVEWGYIGGATWAVLLIGGVGTAVRRAFRHRRDLSFDDRVTIVAMSAAFAGVMLHALVDFPLQVASIQLYVVTLLGIFWGSRRWLAIPEKRPHSRRAATPVKQMQFAP